MKKIIILLLFFFMYCSPRYLDPGTEIIIQAILGGIAAFFTTIAIYWEKVKNFLKKYTKKNKENKNK